MCVIYSVIFLLMECVVFFNSFCPEEKKPSYFYLTVTQRISTSKGSNRFPLFERIQFFFVQCLLLLLLLFFFFCLPRAF